MTTYARNACIVLLVVLATTQAAAAALRAVTSEKAAIAIAVRACDESWGRMARMRHTGGHIGRGGWRAINKGDHWRAWKGSGTTPQYEVDVPGDGRPIDGKETCVAQMGWDQSEGPNRMVTGHFDRHQ